MTSPIARKLEQLQAIAHLAELMMVGSVMAIDDPTTIDDTGNPQAMACRAWLEGFGNEVHEVKDLPKEVRQLLLDELTHEFGL